MKNQSGWKGGVSVVDIHSEEYILGQNIRKYRLEKGWSQKQLSDAVDIDRADISKYENGTKGEMGFKTLKKFAAALEVSTDDLLAEKEKTVEISEEIGVEFAKLTKDGQITIRNMMKFLQSQQMAG
ncbi:XRE family transcriptional regulator [Clostridium sp. AM22-11AC]|nr:XRE family transcriptional regulator [Clostridium sp. AM22-11AC]RHT23550.1 XRE family transcriptional regulator [Clostridium sp. AM32-2]